MTARRELLVVGVDPGSGIKSPTGIGVIMPNRNRLHFARNIKPKRLRLEHRIKEISQVLAEIISEYAAEYDVRIYIESFVMRGKAGETLARLTGALMAAAPYEVAVEFVGNTTVKKIVGGHGRAEKETVAIGVREWMASDADQAAVQDLIVHREWDMLDALAIAIAGAKVHLQGRADD